MNADVSFSMVAALCVQNAARYINGKVLDIGCGAKPYKRLFHDPLRDEYGEGVTAWTGLDVRPVGEIVCDVCSMQESAYDTVLCVDTLSYVFDVHTAFRNMAAALAPGGFLVLVEPNTRADDSGSFWRFPMRGLGALAETNGLEVIELKTLSKLWEGEFENLRGQVKYGFILPGELHGFIDALDDKYPNVSVLIARKGL